MTRHREPDDLPDFDAPDERVVIREIVRVERNNSREHIYSNLIVAAIVALIGAVWVLTMNVAKLMEWRVSTDRWMDKVEERLGSDRVSPRSRHNQQEEQSND
jgi:hypothetical protein